MKQNDDAVKNAARFSKIGGGILLLAVVIAIVVMVLTSPRNAKQEPKPEPTPEPTAVVTAAPAAAPAPRATPTPTPPITAIRLYAYGRELNEDGFTLYVDDKPVELTAVVEPAELQAPVGWTFSDQEAASLKVSSDGRTCTMNALKSNGRNDLTLECRNLSVSFPVYLWEK